MVTDVYNLRLESQISSEPQLKFLPDNEPRNDRLQSTMEEMAWRGRSSDQTTTRSNPTRSMAGVAWRGVAGGQMASIDLVYYLCTKNGENFEATKQSNI